MKRVGSAICGLLLGAPFAAQAAGMNYLDAYYIPDSTLEISGSGGSIESNDGDGFGAKLATTLGDGGLFLAGEYQSADYTASIAGSAEVQTMRVGLGYQTPWSVYLLGEYVRNEAEISFGTLSIKDDEDGFGVHLGAKFDLVKYVTLDARVGYLDVGESDGLEYVVGLGFNLDRHFGLFVDYRVSDLERDDGVEAKVEDIRTGFRFRF